MLPEGRQMPSVFGLLRFFNYLQFQKIKRDSFDKAILGKPGFGNSLEFRNIGIQPDGLTQIKFVTDVVQSLKDHGSTGQAVIGDTDDGILKQMIVFPDFPPHTEHKDSSIHEFMRPVTCMSAGLKKYKRFLRPCKGILLAIVLVEVCIL